MQEFISFISEDVLENEALSGSLSGLDAGSAAQIKSAGALAGAVVSEKAFSPEEMAALLKSLDGLGDMTDRLDANTLELLFLLRASLADSDPEWKLSIEELFRFLSEDVLQDPRFEAFLDEEYRQEISSMEAQLKDGVRQLKAQRI